MLRGVVKELRGVRVVTPWPRPDSITGSQTMYESLDTATLLHIGSSAFFVALVLAIPLTLIATMMLTWRFRHAVQRSMRAAAAAEPVTDVKSPSELASIQLAIDRIETDRSAARSSRFDPSLVAGRRHAMSVAVVYTTAAAVYALLCALAYIPVTGFSVMDQPVWLSLVFVLSFFLVFATPVALAPTTVLKRQARFQWMALGGLLVILVACYRFISTVLPLWTWMAAVPALLVLAGNMRRLRTVAPVVFVPVFLLVFGLFAGTFLAAFHVLDLVGPVRFLDPSLAQLPILDAVTQYYERHLAPLPPHELTAAVLALNDNPSAVIVAENEARFDAWILARFWLILLGITFAGVLGGVVYVRSLARRHQQKRTSDRMLAVDLLMTVFVMPMAMIFLLTGHFLQGVAPLLGFIAFRVTADRGLALLDRNATKAEPKTLLMLRVFGYRRRSQRLLEDIEDRWRFLGPITLLGGPDLANSIIEPREFYQFIGGRLAREFIRDEEHLQSRLDTMRAVQNRDGSWRLQQMLCHANTWRATVKALSKRADTVLMDLRGFGPGHAGCEYEIRQLVAAVAIEKIVLLVDRKTDLPHLEQLLADSAQAVPPDSPNRTHSVHALRVVFAGGRYHRTLDVVMGALAGAIRLTQAAKG